MSLNFEPPAFENAASYLNYDTINVVSADDRHMSCASLVKFSLRTRKNYHPEKAPHH